MLKSLTNFFLIGLLLTGSTVFSSCNNDDDDDGNDPVIPEVVKPNLVFTALTATGKLQTYNANNSSTVANSVDITGLQAGETMLAIDYRPATGQLYGLGSTSRIYTISATGAATAIGAAPFTPGLSGTVAGFDFNPTVDRIRVVTSGGQNLRLHPETGAVAATDGSINGIAGAVITSVAYTNSKAGANTTALFDLDVAAKKLYRQDPPNDGKLVEIGSTGTPDASGESGFDISPDGIGLAVITSGGSTMLYQINTDNGAATNLGTFGTPIIGIAIPTQPVAYAVDDANMLHIFNPTATGQITKTITGLQSGETIFGIDFRPVNGQLYALGSSSRLYTINLATGSAAAVGTGPFTPMLSGTSFGFDFNPTVDRIRVVSNTGQNLRMHPETGVVAVVDGNLNPGTPSVSASAYTNNFAGTTTTTLFGIDFSTDRLYRQVPPNDGTLVDVGPLGINVDAANGFDIGGTSGMAYAILTVGSATKMYTINLNSGTATAGADFPKPVRGFAMGLGF